MKTCEWTRREKELRSCAAILNHRWGIIVKKVKKTRKMNGKKSKEKQWKYQATNSTFTLRQADTHTISPLKLFSRFHENKNNRSRRSSWLPPIIMDLILLLYSDRIEYIYCLCSQLLSISGLFVLSARYIFSFQIFSVLKSWFSLIATMFTARWTDSFARNDILLAYRLLRLFGWQCVCVSTSK